LEPVFGEKKETPSEQKREGEKEKERYRLTR